MSARPTRSASQEGEDKPSTTADGTTVPAAAASEDVVDVHIPLSLTRAGQYRLTVEIRNTDGQVRTESIPFKFHFWALFLVFLLLLLVNTACLTVNDCSPESCRSSYTPSSDAPLVSTRYPTCMVVVVFF